MLDFAGKCTAINPKLNVCINYIRMQPLSERQNTPINFKKLAIGIQYMKVKDVRPGMENTTFTVRVVSVDKP